MSWDDEPVHLHELSAEVLREDLENIAGVLRALAPRVAAMDSRLADAETTVLRADRRGLEAESSQAQLAAQLRRLSARVEWLERNLRRRGEDEVQLDDVPPELLRLARAAQEGRQEALRLLPDDQRGTLEQLVDAHGGAVRRLVGLRREGLVECEVLAGADWTTPAHRQAAARFTRTMTGLREARAEVARLAGPALNAAGRLAEDEERRLDGAGAIEAGEQAWGQLLGLLRDRLAEAVGRGALLPEWFVAVLGPIPAEGDAATWMDVGADLLAYRISYGVTDPASALGARPSLPAEDPHQAAWRGRLQRRLRQLQS